MHQTIVAPIFWFKSLVYISIGAHILLQIDVLTLRAAENTQELEQCNAQGVMVYPIWFDITLLLICIDQSEFRTQVCLKIVYKYLLLGVQWLKLWLPRWSPERSIFPRRSQGKMVQIVSLSNLYTNAKFSLNEIWDLHMCKYQMIAAIKGSGHYW